MHNELYIICHPVKGTMVGRLAFKTKAAAEAYVSTKKGSRYRIERYLPATIVEEIKER